MVFDTNAIRKLGRLSDGEWRRIQRAWRKTGCRTGWIPHVLCEVVASNVARKHGLTKIGLREVQRAVRRYDALCERTVLHDVDEVVFRCIYELAEAEPPPSGLTDHRAGWREVIDLFVRIKDPHQVRAREEEERLVVDLEGNDDNPPGMTVCQPREFVAHAEAKREAMRERLAHKWAVTREQMMQEVVADLPYCWAETAKRLNIPKEVVLRADAREADVILRSPFMIRTFCENTYHHQRAFPRYKGENRKRSSIEENDAPDLAVTTYFLPGHVLVTDDGGLRALLADVLHTERFVLKFSEFVEAVARAGGDSEVSHPLGAESRP